MSMIKAVQCNAEQLAGRVIKKDSRSHPPQFRDPHWNQNPRMGSFLLKGYGHHPRSGINYMRSSPRTTYLVSPQTSKEHMLEKSHLTLFQKRIPSLEDVHRSQLDSSCKKMNPTLLDPTIMADPNESPNAKTVY